MCIHFDEYDTKTKGIPLVSCHREPIKWIPSADVGKLEDFEKTSDLNRIPEIVENIILIIHFDEYDQKSNDIPFVLYHRKSIKWILPADVAKLGDLEKASDLNRIPENVENIILFHTFY